MKINPLIILFFNLVCKKKNIFFLDDSILPEKDKNNYIKNG